jgi:uncharacterized protein (TIGR03435 family)
VTRPYTDPVFADLLRDARDQADRSPPPIKSAALVHIARVLTAVDRAEAERVLDEGLGLAAALAPDERDILMGEGAVLAATVSPRRAFTLLPSIAADRDSVVTQALCRMVDHGYAAEAAEYLSAPAPAASFPFSIVLHAIGRSSDDEVKRRVLRRAIDAMRAMRAGGRTSPFGWRDFISVFTFFWRLLPPEEARGVVRDIVDRILAEPNQRMNASFGAGAYAVTFTSTHEQRLFEILEPLQSLDPERAATVVSRYPHLTAAALRFPHGEASMTAMMMADSPSPPVEPAADALADMDVIDAGHRFIPIREAIRTEFSEAFAAALDEYDADADPEDVNVAPKQCWPSAAAFRTILYKAGAHEGPAAARHLERIPDPALRLFAQIELAAALAGLPQLGSRTLRRGARARRREMAAAECAGAAVPPIDPRLFELPPPRKPDLPPSRRLRVTPATAPAGDAPSGGCGADFVDVRNASLGAVVSYLYETPPSRIEWPASIDPAARFDFALVLPRDESAGERMRLVREGIAIHFGARMSVGDRMKDVWVLTAPNGIRCRERRVEPRSGFSSIAIQSREGTEPSRMPEAFRLHQILGTPFESNGRDASDRLTEMRREMTRTVAAMAGSGTPIAGIEGSFTIPELCAAIEPGLDRPLVDETGLRGTYALALEADEGAAGGVLSLLTTRLGLVAERARRSVPTLVVAPQ